MKKKLSRLIMDRKESLVAATLRGIGSKETEQRRLPCLLDTLLGCISSVLVTGHTTLPECRTRLGWDLPEAPSLKNTYGTLIALKRAIVRTLEKEFAHQPHLLVMAICELEESLDTILGFLLAEENPPACTDLVKIGETLSRRYTEDVISIYDLEGRLVYQSPSIERILGYTTSEWREEGPRLMIKNPVYRVIPQGARRSPHVETVCYMVVIPHKNGGEKIVQVEEKFIQGRKREIIGLWTRMHDVSVREHLARELAAANEKYEQIFEESADVMFVLDSHGMLQSVNRRFRELTGFSSDYLRGKSLESLIHKDDRERWKKEMEKLLEGRIVEFEARLFPVNGNYAISSFRCKPLGGNGAQLIIIGIARDISEKKRIEAELESKVDLLDRYRKASADREKRIKELLEELERSRGGEQSDRE